MTEKVVKHWPPGEPPGPKATETAPVFPSKQPPKPSQTEKEKTQ